MFIVHLSQKVPNFNKTIPDGYGNNVAQEENSLRIVADKYKRLKSGIVKFYLNEDVVADVEGGFIIAIIDEG